MGKEKVAKNLLPCPFCGTTDLINERARVGCLECGVVYERPFVSTNESAAYMWNNRYCWQPIETAPTDPEGPAILLYSHTLADDLDYPGHPMTVTNMKYVVNGNAVKHGYTMWAPIPKLPPREEM